MKEKQSKSLGGGICLLFKNLDNQMKQKTVWGIVGFLHCFSFIHCWGKKKDFLIKMKVENITNIPLRSF